MNEITFTVYGRPQPQGSMRSFRVQTKAGPTVNLTSDNKNLKSWRQEVSKVAIETMAGRDMLRRPATLAVSVEFYFARPQSLPKKVLGHSKKPDLSKLLRALEDALTGICYEDDAQINVALIQKRYGGPERTVVTLMPKLPPVFYFEWHKPGDEAQQPAQQPAQQRMAL